MRRNPCCRSAPLALLAPLAVLVAAAVPTAVGHDVVDYRSQVEPIFQRSCSGNGACHIGFSTSGVNLSHWDDVMASRGVQYGSLVVVPGNPESSPLIDKVSSLEPFHGERMPLGLEPLSEVEIALLSRWIREGATKGHGLSREDPNQDGRTDLSDAVILLFYLFQGGAPPRCLALYDVNGLGGVDVSDAVFVLNYLFQGGPAPPPLTEDEERTCQAAGELSYASIYQNVFAATCAFSSCHSAASRKGGLVLEGREESHRSLVGVIAANEAALAAGLLRVKAGVPEESFLLKKLSQPGPGEGNRMPPTSSVGLPEEVMRSLREWILAGAPFEGTIRGVPDLGEVEFPPADRMPAPPVPENGVQLHLPPFTIGPSSEREIFYYMDKPLASLPEDPVVERIDIHMMESTHHFILYQWTGSSPPPAGVRDISGVFDLINGRRLVLGAQQSFFSLAFPPGVGLKLSRTASFDLNSHYVNLSGREPLYGEVYTNLFFAAPGSVQTFVQPVFDVNINIFVPPNQTRTTKSIFPMSSSGRVPSGRQYHIYALSSHMHRHGVDFKVFRTQNGADVNPPELVYRNTNWDDPLFQTYDPPLVLTAGQGLRFEVTHAYLDPPSSSSPALTFGLTSEDEMAILLGYYAVK